MLGGPPRFWPRRQNPHPLCPLSPQGGRSYRGYNRPEGLHPPPGREQPDVRPAGERQRCAVWQRGGRVRQRPLSSQPLPPWWHLPRQGGRDVPLRVSLHLHRYGEGAADRALLGFLIPLAGPEGSHSLWGSCYELQWEGRRCGLEGGV